MAFLKMNKRNLISSLVAFALLLIGSILSGNSINLPELLGYVLIYAIAALSLNIICGCLGEFVLGHGGFVLIGYTTAYLVSNLIKNAMGKSLYREIVFKTLGAQLYPLGYGLIIVDVLIAAVVTGLIGFVIGTIALGRLKGDYLAIVTLGIGSIFVLICYNIDPLGGSDGKSAMSYLGGKPIIYAVFFILVLILILSFMKSRFGRAILACRDDNIAAEASGVAVGRTKVLAFTFATFIAGIAGGLLCHHTSVNPQFFDLKFSIELLIIIVLGGLGSLTGTMVASIIIVFYKYWFINQSWVPNFFAENDRIIYGIILVAIMLFRSKGILGTSEFTWNWFYSKLKWLWSKIISIFKKKTPKEVE